jgi:Flp pilus assembly protein TadB
MWTALGDLGKVMGSQQFWGSTIRLAILVAFGLAVLLIAFTTFVVIPPLALAGGLALHLYLRRKLRQARQQYARQHYARQADNLVIEGEYTVVDRR